MNKKNYTTPALSVEEFEMNEVICTSGNNTVNYVDGGDSGISMGKVDPNGGTIVRAKNRGGIWDED